MVNTHFQTFIEDNEIIIALDELQKKKNFKSRSQLTKEALKEYLKLDEMNIAIDFKFNDWLDAKKEDFIASITYDRSQKDEKCIKINGIWMINPTHKDRCFNINCTNQFCISTKINKMVKEHFNKEEKKFINSLQGTNWKKDFINEFNSNYVRGLYEPGNNTSNYINNAKIDLVKFWLDNHLHSRRNTSSRQ